MSETSDFCHIETIISLPDGNPPPLFHSYTRERSFALLVLLGIGSHDARVTRVDHQACSDAAAADRFKRDIVAPI